MISMCRDCQYCEEYEYKYGETCVTERYCSCDSSKFNNGEELDGLECGKCMFFSHKDIKRLGNTYNITIKTSYTNINKNAIICECSDLGALNRFLKSNTETFYSLIKEMKKSEELKNEIVKEKGFIDFFKDELPDVYKEMWKQYCKSKHRYEPNPKENERFDNKGNQLRTGESQRKDGRYMYRWTVNGQEKTVYALSIEELRIKEVEAQIDDSR